MKWHCLGRGTLHYIDGDTLYASTEAQILVSRMGAPFVPFATLPIRFVDAVLCKSRLLSRFRRRMVSHIVRFRDRIVVVAFGHIWCFTQEGRLVEKPTPLRGSRPLAICATPEAIYYGEYRNNSQRSPIALLRSVDGVRWDECYRFNGVRHIHGVYYDLFTRALWITTGDSDQESALWRSDDGGNGIVKVVGGSQSFRAIPLLFSDRHILFGSDAPQARNFIYRLDRASVRVEPVFPVEGPIFHGAKTKNIFMFSSAVEPSRMNQARDAVLYCSSDGETWTAVARHTKDIWHMKAFQYGQLILPSGDNCTGRMWYSTFATVQDYRIFYSALNAKA